MKCVIIIDKDLPKGLMANTAAVIGISMGDKHLGVIGGKTIDKSGSVHEGITSIPIPILSSTKEKTKEIRNKVSKDKKVHLVDFSNVAQRCKDYDDYTEKMLDASDNSIDYLGVGVWGDLKNVSRLTGNLPLLR